jgi:hypothetical protein
VALQHTARLTVALMGDVEVNDVRRVRWIAPALALALYALLALLLYLRAWAAPTDTWAGNLGDPAGFMWLLSRTPGVVDNLHGAFFTNNVNYPFGHNLMWAPNIPLVALLAWPITHLWGPVAAYNTVMTAGFALSAWAAFFAARRFVTSALGAAIAGLLYGFSPYMVAHGYGHLNMTFVVVPPLLLLVLDEVLRRQRVPPYLAGLMLAGLAAAQYFISQEIILSSGVIALVGLVVLLVAHRGEIRPRARHAAACFAVAVPTFAVIVAYPLRVMFFGPQRLGAFPTDLYVNDLLTFVVPPPTVRFAGISALAPWRQWTGNPAEWNGYLGLPLLVLLCTAAFALRRNPRARFFIIMTALSALLSMGAFLHVNGVVTRVPLPWWLAANLPVTRNMEAARLMLYGYLFAGILVATLVDACWPRWRRLAPYGAVAALAAVSLVPRGYAGQHVPQPAFFATRHAVDVPYRSVALVAPLASPANPDLDMFQPMLWLAEGNRYCIAESPIAGNDPQGRPLAGSTPTMLGQVMIQVQAGAPPPRLSPQLRAQLTEDLRSRRVGTVIVGPMRHQAGTVALFTDLLGRPPAFRDGVYVWSSGPGAELGPTGCA